MQAFTKYLPAHGWDVHVLTARHGDAAFVDPPGVSAVSDPWRGGSPIGDYDPRERPTLGSRLRGFLRDCIFPDRFVRWQRAAFVEGLNVVRGWKPDLILASFPPASAVELAARLRDATGVPLVLDYRDKWLGPGGYQPKRRHMEQRHVELERRALAASTAVIAVSEALIQDIVQKPVGHASTIPAGQLSTLSTQLSAERTGLQSAVIYNGFEPIAAPNLAPPNPDASTRQLTLAHVGTVIPRNRPDLFFSSLAAVTPSNVHFRFVGNLSASYLAHSALTKIVTTTGLVSRETARSEMFGADALLLLTGDYVGHWGYSVKLFEYLQTGRPILCLEETPGSNDARLLRELAPERCFIGKLGDADSLAEQLIHVRNYLENETRSSARPLPTISHGLARYSRAIQTAELARFIDTIVNK